MKTTDPIDAAAEAIQAYLGPHHPKDDEDRAAIARETQTFARLIRQHLGDPAARITALEADLAAAKVEIERLKPHLMQMSGVIKESNEWESKFYAAQERAEAAETVVSKLPLTADGVPVVPGMPIYEDDGVGGIYEFTAGRDIPQDGTLSHLTRYCYSTREAALAAKAGGQ